MHVISVDQFEPEWLKSLFERADEFQIELSDPEKRRKLALRYVGRQVCSLFYEPSTRTRTSFEKAALNLGMGVVSTENAKEFSSAIKGETIEDTIRVIDGYGFDAIVIRHHETGAAARAAAVSKAPIINAGDGKGEHPTQALLDVYTIYKKFGRLDNLKVVIGGDLKHGRTARSLSQLLAKYPGNEITYVSIPELQMEEDIKEKLRQSGTKFRETENMGEAFKTAQVVYWTRLQKERLEDPSVLKEKSFVIDKKSLEVLPKDSIIMHPLPKVDEITIEVDGDPRAVYFEQARNGLYVRMALLDYLLTNK